MSEFATSFSSRRMVVVTSFLVIHALFGSPLAHAQAPAAAVQGLWQGSIMCGKGGVAFNVDLRLKAMPSGDVFGVVETSTSPDAPNPLPPGSYRVSGHLAEGGALLLNPVEWIKQPAPNVMMGTLDGTVAIDGKGYAGHLRECKSANTFATTKSSDNPDAVVDRSKTGATVRAPGAEAAPAASQAEGGGFFSSLAGALKKGLGQMGDPVIVRGYIHLDDRNMALNPLCLYDLKTKELQANGVFGRVTMHQNGSPGFQTTRVSMFDCQKAEQNGDLVVTDYTDMSPETTPFRGSKGTPSLGQTPLVQIFSRTPFDGTQKTWFPRVAVTVTNWTATTGCWIATATIWQSATHSTPVAPFNVCWPRGDANATNRLVEGDALMNEVNQQQPEAGTGNIRTAGPKAPMRGLPERYPSSVARGPYIEFLHALTFGTGWVAGAPTNLWIVGFVPG